MTRPGAAPAALSAALACAALLGTAVLATGCRAKTDAAVDGVLLAQADGVVDAPEGPTLAVDEKTIDAAVVPTGAKIVRLAIGRKVLWNQVRALMDKVTATGARPVILVGRSYHLKEMRLEDEWPGGPALQVMALIDGKACVQPPGAIEAKCVQSGTKQYIERAYLRELVREQVKVFNIEQVEVELPETLSWYDVVRTIDGTRTCCQETPIRVRLKPTAPAEPEPEAAATTEGQPDGAAAAEAPAATADDAKAIGAAVTLELPNGASWADMTRAIDEVRSCCTKARVRAAQRPPNEAATESAASTTATVEVTFSPSLDPTERAQTVQKLRTCCKGAKVGVRVKTSLEASDDAEPAQTEGAETASDAVEAAAEKAAGADPGAE